MPAAEFRAVLAHLNQDLELQAYLPSTQDEPGFEISFGEPGSPRPRYLGQLINLTHLSTMESNIPNPDFKVAGEADFIDPSLEAFKKKVQLAIQSAQPRLKPSKEKKKISRVIDKYESCTQLKRAQRYLGLRANEDALVDPHNTETDWAKLQEALKEYEVAKAKFCKVVDVTKPVPFLFDQNVVFISVDIEASEISHNLITEIGISTLDTNDLIDLVPGEIGSAWMNRINSRHFRITEYAHHVNSKHVDGCPDKFEKDFGISEWISIEEAPKVIESCFQFPRNIVLVGHDIKTDIKFLSVIGFDVGDVSNITEAIDTADMFRALKHEAQPRSLAGILKELNLVAWNLHNAVRTIQFFPHTCSVIILFEDSCTINHVYLPS